MKTFLLTFSAIVSLGSEAPIRLDYEQKDAVWVANIDGSAAKIASCS
ncbi:MAG: hypothetical protein ACXWFY_07620 [Chthoniobacterales bacterium]